MKSRFGNVCFTGVLTSGLYPVNVSENTYTHGTVGISGSLVTTATNLPTWWENGIVFASTFDVHSTASGPVRSSYINDASPYNNPITWPTFGGSFPTNNIAVSYTHLTLPTTLHECRSRWSPYH